MKNAEENLDRIRNMSQEEYLQYRER